MKKGMINNFGYTMVELLLVASIVGVIPVSVYVEAAKRAKAASCMSNLRNVYIGLQMYEMDFGKLPDAKFYPESVGDPKSIVSLLSGYIDDKSVYVCPSMPDELANRKLTYIWDDNFSGIPLARISDKSTSWVMTEMSAVDANIPPPHSNSYNMLFLDGHVESMEEVSNLMKPPSF